MTHDCQVSNALGWNLRFAADGDILFSSLFSDPTVEVQHTQCVVQHMLLRYRVTQSISAPLAAPASVIHLSVDPRTDGMLSLVDLSDSNEEPDSDSNSDSDNGMPPLINLSDSDSGYGSD
ncbi:hypothetical protein C8J56DRAFT_1063273 [Mycena floridula]|nr:hypothetical protein C8J56DRAFT_1063273 [Mycena floridula]